MGVQKNTVRTIQISGRMNILNHSRTKQQLSVKTGDKFFVLLLDLSQVGSIDSTGIGAILSLNESLLKEGKEIMLRRASRTRFRH